MLVDLAPRVVDDGTGSTVSLRDYPCRGDVEAGERTDRVVGQHTPVPLADHVAHFGDEVGPVFLGGG